MNNKLSERFIVKNVIMQGTVWSSLKCTSTMDKLNKFMLQKPQLKYLYQEDPNIAVGVLGMVDDTLGIAECGNKSIAKNAVINSFIETERLTMSKEKSSVIHISGRKKCKSVCPKLKVHDSIMKSVEVQNIWVILSHLMEA